ncbi:LicD family protein [Clostridium polynesiense]|uniref:LicD family protein n=1 Tax=Clostridium polynesiense TaxID=1325933 RepID=UPI000694E7D3|nr:LicD family protein [Clostridium polynesiense]
MSSKDNYKNLEKYIKENDFVIADIDTAHGIMLTILKEIDRICSKNNLKYFLCDGTLLGAIRHKGFIPWDDDLDIAMPREDYELFKEIATKEISEDFFVQTKDTDNEYDIYHIPLKVRHNNSVIIEEKNKSYHQGLYVDIFPIDKVPESKGKALIQKLLSNMWTIKLPINTEDFPKPKFFLRSFSQLIGFLIPPSLILKLQLFTLKWNRYSKSHLYTYGVELTWKTYFEEEDLFPLQKIKFEDGTFWGPNKPEKILSDLYGDYMKLPPVEERRVHGEEMYVRREMNDLQHREKN